MELASACLCSVRAATSFSRSPAFRFASRSDAPAAFRVVSFSRRTPAGAELRLFCFLPAAPATLAEARPRRTCVCEAQPKRIPAAMTAAATTAVMITVVKLAACIELDRIV